MDAVKHRRKSHSARNRMRAIARERGDYVGKWWPDYWRSVSPAVRDGADGRHVSVGFDGMNCDNSCIACQIDGVIEYPDG